jgi:DNA-binding NtrC family response regulator
MDEIERQAIEATLDYTKGDKTHAARALGIGRKTLYRKLDQYTAGNTTHAPIDQPDSKSGDM